MRFDKAVVVIAVAALLAWGLGAKDDKTLVIGIVDLDQAISATARGKAARDELERKAREAEAKFAPLRDSYEEAVKELEAKRFILSEEALLQKQLDIQGLQNKIETARKEIEGDLELSRARVIVPLRTELVGIVEEVGREGGFSLILMKGMQGVLYSREALDVTDLVIEKLNQKS